MFWLDLKLLSYIYLTYARKYYFETRWNFTSVTFPPYLLSVYDNIWS